MAFLNAESEKERRYRAASFPLEITGSEGEGARPAYVLVQSCSKGKRGSCSECRQRKRKCCRRRPCLNCISRSLICIAADDDEQVVQVKVARPSNPVASVRWLRIDQIAEAARVHHIAASAAELKLSPVPVVCMTDAGFLIRPLLDILIKLPPSVKNVLDEWLPKLSVNASRLNAMMSKMSRPTLAAPEVLDTPDVNTGLGIDAIEEMVKCDAWLSITYDLVQGGRQFIKMGAGLAGFFNFHAEEMLARVAANNLPLNCTEVEAFCTMMYTLVGPLKPAGFHENGAPSSTETTFVSRYIDAFHRGGSSSDPEPIIAKQRFIRVLDKCGRMTVSLDTSCVIFLVLVSSCVGVHAERACAH